MKCTECGLEKPKSEFRYLYNAKIDGSVALRQCPQCAAWLAVDELHGAADRLVRPGDTVWTKSAGVGASA